MQLARMQHAVSKAAPAPGRAVLQVCAVARPSQPSPRQRTSVAANAAKSTRISASAAAGLVSLASVDCLGDAGAPAASAYPKPLDLNSLFDGYSSIGNTVTHHALRRFRSTRAPIAKYLFLRDLQLFNPLVYFHLLLTRTQELLPFIYTPTVGDACQNYHELPMMTQGLYISLRDRGSILAKLRAWGQQDVRVVVATDGERILGLGDLGCNGMGISEGKIQLYTAAAGVNPSVCLPICLDVGTNNAELLADPKYRGLRQARATGDEYFSFVHEFVEALKQWQPHVLLQFEDFGNGTAFDLLERYQHEMAAFNDDIQGTACITLAGVLSALRASGQRLSDQRVLFYGAGEAGTGIGTLIAQALVKEAADEGVVLSLEEARRHCAFMDSKGLICASRPDAVAGKLAHHKVPFAHNVQPASDLLSAVHQLRPTVLIGVSTCQGAFTPEVLRAMAAINARPIIMPLSNPTSCCECTFAEAYEATGGRVLFASGSPFEPLTVAGPDGDSDTTVTPAQANNAYIFPAVGHAAVLTRASCIPNEVFLVAARALASQTSLDELQRGFLFPPFARIRAVSAVIMAAVCEWLVDHGLGTPPAGFDGANWRQLCEAAMWDV